MSAWIAWSLQQLSAKETAAQFEEATVDEAIEVESVEAIASTSETTDGEPEPIEESEVSEPIQSIEPISNLSPEQPIANGLESKLDKLLDVMAQFVQFQLQAQTPQIQQPIEQKAIAQPGLATVAITVLESEPTTQPAIADQMIDTAEKANTEESKPRKYKTGEADAIANQAIDAIMQHNNQTNQIQDLKWAITINGLKNFTSNQRVIERIMQERKDEIDAHHQLHQLLPDHNHRHKRKRKIGDVIQL
jgi:hypothetical protein